MHVSRRLFVGSAMAGIPALALGTTRALEAARAGQKETASKGSVAAAIIDGMRRNHADLKRRGVKGEHGRVAAAHLRLLAAHCAALGVDDAVKRGMRRKIADTGREAFYNTDFAGDATKMIKHHLGEDVVVYSQPSRRHIERFTDEMLTVGFTPFLGRLAGAAEYQSRALDAMGNNADHVRVVHAALMMQCESDGDPFYDDCWGGGGDFNGGGGVDLCRQAQIGIDAAAAAQAIACTPWVAAIFPEGCLAAVIFLVDLIMVKYALGC